MNGRIKRLKKIIKNYESMQRPTVFLLEGGDRFVTEQDTIGYLINHGTETPKGRIVAYEYETAGMDSLSLSLCELVDEGIRRGGLQWLLDDLEA